MPYAGPGTNQTWYSLYLTQLPGAEGVCYLCFLAEKEAKISVKGHRDLSIYLSYPKLLLPPSRLNDPFPCLSWRIHEAQGLEQASAYHHRLPSFLWMLSCTWTSLHPPGLQEPAALISDKRTEQQGGVLGELKSFQRTGVEISARMASWSQ